MPEEDVAGTQMMCLVRYFPLVEQPVAVSEDCGMPVPGNA